MGEFSSPFFSKSPCFLFFLTTSTRLWFYYIITKIQLPFQNPGSAPENIFLFGRNLVRENESQLSVSFSLSYQLS